ncbi:4-hydroxy-2-oxovalerate aldolase [Candidatus Rickettsiella isopodorum]|jgi:4-hydroxy 2-oxovalerate aldolase|uniref:4-hydroxy-2-oxovalerate aldolase n=1 Tax=Candidatus Rickettsiella isopodorum TaxID=1225476 RepID=A0A1J8NJ20_9COXI|nr:4-hydroxy-2-oxovalerate aldolase [Candidatus Rickettsiella isopodorum]OIZ95160.1 4-hydroxy-2-oxovalerate aldolase [Candidatus Rickettsiella isopodorum]
MRSILISDPTLRDGNHALKHQLNGEQIANYCIAAESAGIPIVEVGHGNGLGASSLQLGIAKLTDEKVLNLARTHLKKSRLGIHIIPGFGTVKKDLRPAIELGVDVVRVAAHCSEADIAERHIQFVRMQEKTVYGVLMMAHMISSKELLIQAAKMEAYGAQGIVFMDSAGNFLPEDVIERVKILVDHLSIPIGFHAHNNLGLAIANSLVAVEAGATILDGCARGFGAGAGNTQLEVLVGVLDRKGYHTGIDFYKMLDASDIAEKELLKEIPAIKSLSIISGLAGVFSGFLKPVLRIAKEFEVDPRDIFIELGRRRIIAGQEDIIIEVANDLAKKAS